MLSLFSQAVLEIYKEIKTPTIRVTDPNITKACPIKCVPPQ